MFLIFRIDMNSIKPGYPSSLSWLMYCSSNTTDSLTISKRTKVHCFKLKPSCPPCRELGPLLIKSECSLPKRYKYLYILIERAF